MQCNGLTIFKMLCYSSTNLLPIILKLYDFLFLLCFVKIDWNKNQILNVIMIVETKEF